MTIEALLFDVDGTLADTEERHRQAFNAAFRDHGLPYSWEPDEYRALLRVPGGKERLAHYFEGKGLGTVETVRLLRVIPELHRTKTKRYEALVAAGSVPLLPGVARLIRAAWEAQIPVGIATTTTAANVHALVRAGLGEGAVDRFAVIASGDMVQAKKPAPDIYLLALSRQGLGPERVVAFEDSLPGLTAAQAAGLFTVVTPTVWADGDDLGAADLLLPHLGDPERPLEAEAARRAGGAYVSLAGLEALRERRKRTA